MPKIATSGCVSFISQVSPNSIKTRKINASDSPIWRA